MANMDKALHGLSESSKPKKGTKRVVNLGKKGKFSVHKGALHKALGIPEGEKIPASKLEPKPSDSSHVKHMKASAKGLKAMK